MKHFWTRTDSIPWAVALAGAVSKTPKEFSIALVSDNPVVKMIGESVGGTRPQGQEIVLPSTTAELGWLDAAQAFRLQREMEEIHGLVLDQKVQVLPLQYPQLVSNLLLHKYGVFAQHGYYCPNPALFYRKQVQKYSDYTVLIDDLSFMPQVNAFWEGWGLPHPPQVLDLKTLDPLEQVYALCALNRAVPGVVLLHTNNPLNHVARAWYTDLQCLRERPAILSILPADMESLDRRASLYWSQQIPAIEDDELDIFKKRGYAWKVRWECGFDNHEYYRRRAKGMY